jgi:hypothetical protein
MGIKNFTKLFKSSTEIKLTGALREFKNKNIVVDAMAEIYRCALGAPTIDTLTDKNGQPTIHINSIMLGVIFKLKKAGALQYWIFDHNSHTSDSDHSIHHNPLKQLEISKRTDRRKKAQILLDDVLSKEGRVLFSDDDTEAAADEAAVDEAAVDESAVDEAAVDEAAVDEADKTKKKSQTRRKKTPAIVKKNKLEKITFQLQDYHIQDVQFILDCLNIPWAECPAGYESEQIAAALTCSSASSLVPVMDYVLSPDSDSLLFGAKLLIKRDTRKKKLFIYNLKDILRENNITQEQLIKIGIALGSDFAPKTPRAGPGTILKPISKKKARELNIDMKTEGIIRNIDIIELTDKQKEAMKLFQANVKDVIDQLKWNNLNYNEKKIDTSSLLDWLVNSKGFNKNRMETQIKKLMNAN